LTEKVVRYKHQQPTRRFGASGGAVPQKRQGTFASSSPVRVSVSRRLRQAALALAASVGRQCVKTTFDLFLRQFIKTCESERERKTNFASINPINFVSLCCLIEQL
jgi:hypothetical protein